MSQLTPITIRSAGPADRKAVESLLTRTGLPIDGVADHLDHFAVAVDGDAVIGSAGLEVYGPHALLRSVAVLPERQHSGLGHECAGDREREVRPGSHPGHPGPGQRLLRRLRLLRGLGGPDHLRSL